jgi:hypothetical protein
VTLYSDLDQLENEFIKIAPEDTKNIKKFIKDMKVLSTLINAVDKEKWNLLDHFSYYKNNLRHFLKVMKYAKITMEDLSRQWNSKKLQQVFEIIIPPSWSSLSLLFGIAFQHVKAG